MDTEERTVHVLIGCKGCTTDGWVWGEVVPRHDHAVCKSCKLPQPPNQHICPRCRGEVVLRE